MYLIICKGFLLKFRKTLQMRKKLSKKNELIHLDYRCLGAVFQIQA